MAVGYGTHHILYSKDGTSWQDTATGTSKFGGGGGCGWGIAYGTSSDGSCLWVAVGSGTHHILYSKDGTSWQDTATGTSKFDGGYGRGIAYGTSSDGSCLWVAVGYGTHHILYSKDGTSWQDTATGTSKFGTCALTDYGLGIAYGKNSEGSCLWVATGKGDYHILYSTDGTSWQAVTEGTSKFGPGGTDQGRGIANNHLLYGMSPDYYRGPAPDPVPPVPVLGEADWVAVGKGTHNILYSKDGTSWQDTATGTSKFGGGGGEGNGIGIGSASSCICVWVDGGADPQLK